MTPEQQIKELKEKNASLEARLSKVENFTTNLGGSYEFKTLVQRYSGEVNGVVGTFSKITINGDLDHDGTKIGFFGTAPATQRSSIVNADGTLADITTKFNTLLSHMDTYGLTA